MCIILIYTLIHTHRNPPEDIFGWSLDDVFCKAQALAAQLLAEVRRRDAVVGGLRRYRRT